MRELFELMELIVSYIQRGLRADDIVARLGAPDSVGRNLLERAASRRAAGDNYLAGGE